MVIFHGASQAAGHGFLDLRSDMDSGQPERSRCAGFEVGLKFRSNTDGFITGVRFYKGFSTNGGRHIGRLWTNSGTLLGSVTFANETISGWQEANFPTPIPVTAGTVYVVLISLRRGIMRMTITLSLAMA